MNTKSLVGGISCGVLSLFLFIFTLSMILTSKKDIPTNFNGLAYNQLTQSVSTKSEGPGTYIKTPATRFILFPSNLVWIRYPELPCYSKEGIPLVLTVNFQYQYIKDNLHDLYFKFGEHASFSAMIHLIGSGSIRNVCGMFNYQALFENRTAMEQALRQAVNVELMSFSEYCTVGTLDLQNIALPTELNDAIANKQNSIEEITRALAERDQTLIASTTELRSAEQNRDIEIINKKAEAEARRLRAETNVQNTRVFWQGKADGYISIKSSLGLNVTEFIKYLEINPSIL